MAWKELWQLYILVDRSKSILLFRSGVSNDFENFPIDQDSTTINRLQQILTYIYMWYIYIYVWYIYIYTRKSYTWLHQEKTCNICLQTHKACSGGCFTSLNSDNRCRYMPPFGSIWYQPTFHSRWFLSRFTTPKKPSTFTCCSSSTTVFSTSSIGLKRCKSTESCSTSETSRGFSRFCFFWDRGLAIGWIPSRKLGLKSRKVVYLELVKVPQSPHKTPCCLSLIHTKRPTKHKRCAHLRGLCHELTRFVSAALSKSPPNGPTIQHLEECIHHKVAVQSKSYSWRPWRSPQHTTCVLRLEESARPPQNGSCIWWYQKWDPSLRADQNPKISVLKYVSRPPI